jgi:hypothetical protein
MVILPLIFAGFAAMPRRHCEEQSDEAIQSGITELDCFASLAMTLKLF